MNRALLGCWLHERWRTEVVLRVPGLARALGWDWRGLRNRHETLVAGDGQAVVCGWQDSSPLTVARIFPEVGARLLRHCVSVSSLSLAPSSRPASASPALTVVLPVAGTDRMDAFETVLASLMAQDLDRLEVVVAEHAEAPEYHRFSAGAVRHVHVPRGEGEAFNKSRAFNRGVAEATAPAVLLHDADVVVPRDYLSGIVERLDAGFEAVRPMRLLFYLDEGSSAAFGESRGLSLPDRVEQVLQNFPGLSTAVTREAYETIGGHDERFEGWGGEDTEFLERLETRRLFRGGYTYGIHLWHPPAPKYASGDRNRQVFEEVTRWSPRERIERLRERKRA